MDGDVFVAMIEEFEVEMKVSSCVELQWGYNTVWGKENVMYNH